MKTGKLKKVQLPHGGISKMANDLGMTTVWVSRCLSTIENCEAAQKLRKLAIKKYHGTALYEKSR